MTTAEQLSGGEFLAQTAVPFNQLIARYLKAGKDGVIVGHQHGLPGFYTAFAELLPFLKPEGVTHLFMEFPENYQPDITIYLRTGIFTPGLASELAQLDLLWNKEIDHRVIFRSARKNGIRVYCIDRSRSSAAQMENVLFGEVDRNSHMLRNFAAIRGTETGKFLMFCGNGHAALQTYSLYVDKKLTFPLAFQMRLGGYNFASCMSAGKITHPVEHLVHGLRTISTKKPIGWDMRDVTDRGTFIDASTYYDRLPIPLCFDALAYFPPLLLGNA